MAKGKAGGENKGKGGGVQNKAIYSRISFLQQAAITLSAIQHPSPASDGPGSGTANGVSAITPLQGVSRRLATDLRSVSLKTRIRLNPAVKQTICKFCDSPLIEGETCTSSIENRSKGGRKPWADALVRKCHTCGRERRYPVSATRPRRKTERGLVDSGGSSQNQKQKG